MFCAKRFWFDWDWIWGAQVWVEQKDFIPGLIGAPCDSYQQLSGQHGVPNEAMDIQIAKKFSDTSLKQP